jgi:hypothetical protein
VSIRLEKGSTEATPLRRSPAPELVDLAVAVLRSALSDLQSADPRHRKSAHMFFFGAGPDADSSLELWATVIDRPVARLRAAVATRLERACGSRRRGVRQVA